MSRRLFSMIGILLLVGLRDAVPYEFQSADARALAVLIEQSLSQGGSGSGECVAREIRRRFHDLRRDQTPLDDLIELKYKMQFWRSRLPRCCKSFRKQIRSSVAEARALDARASHEARQTMNDTPAASTRAEGHEFFYRGLLLKPGDILLSDLSHGASGLISHLCEPRPHFAHFAFFFVRQNGKRVKPAVMEFFRSGVRVVRPSVFFSFRHTSYVEAYRFVTAEDVYPDRIDRKILPIAKESHPYSFYGDNDDRVNLNCATVGSLILERLGLEPIRTKGRIREGILRNWRKLGPPAQQLLIPTDYLVDPRLRFVGALDRGSFTRSVVRELVLRRVTQLHDDHKLDRERLPRKFRLYLRAVVKMQRGKAGGRMLSSFYGFGGGNFPVGPSEVVAWVALCDRETKRATGRALRRVRVPKDWTDFSIHDFEADPEVRKEIDASVAPIRAWFSDAR